jgi:DNA-binding ferritin-like protein
MPNSNDNSIKLLEDINQRLKESPAMNGGFTRLTADVKEIKEKIDRLYDPETGTYAKMHRISLSTEQFDKDLKEHIQEDLEENKQINENLQKIEEDIKTVSKNLDSIKKLEEISGGKSLEDLNSLLKFRKNFDKLFWLLLASLVGSFGKIVWEFITRH